MTTEPPLLLDTDFVSSFAWVDRMDIIEGLYSGRMIVLEEVMVELERTRHLGDLVCFSIMHGHIKRLEMMVGTAEALEYVRLSDTDRYGSGEAACMAFASCRGGIVASNNLKDVRRYCEERRIPLVTTSDVLVRVYEEGRLTLDETDALWREMVARRRRLPAVSFREYLEGVGRVGGPQW